MESLLEILSPSFLLRDALYCAVILGAVCPLVGVYLVLRRMIFFSVAVPHISAAGIAFAFFVFSLLQGGHQHGMSGEQHVALVGSLAFTIISIFLLAGFEVRRGFSAEARVGVAYGIAGALTYIFLALDPGGEAQMVGILKGDILAANRQSLVNLLVVAVPSVIAVFKFRRQFLLVSFDRDLARVFRFPVRVWDGLLYLIIGAIISIGVMTSGPLVVFGFLLMPALIARQYTNHMLTFSLLASGIGALSAFLGFYLSYVLDLPLGPAEVALAGAALVVSSLLGLRRRGFESTPP